MILSRALAVASLLVGVGALTACPGMNQTHGVEVPAKGTPITQEIYAKLLPAPKVGQKWVYLETLTVPEEDTQRADLTLEITAIDGDVLTTTQTRLIEGQTSPSVDTATSSISQPLEMQEGLSVTSGGAENVTVPHKAYTGAAKLIGTVDGETAYTVWLVPGVGLVKLDSGASESGRYLMELKDFKQP